MLRYGRTLVTLSTTLALAGGASTYAGAQQPAAAAERAAAAKPVPAMPSPLDGIALTAAQRAAIAADWERRKPALRALQAAGRATGRMTDAERAAIRAFADERNAAVRKILTAEQNAQLDRNLARMHEVRRQQAAARRGRS